MPPVPIRISCFNNPYQLSNCLDTIFNFVDDPCVHVYDDISDYSKFVEIQKICDSYLVPLVINKQHIGWTGKPASKLVVPQLQEMRGLAASYNSDKVIKMDSDALIARRGLNELFNSFKGDLGGTLESGAVSCKLQRNLWRLAPSPEHHIQGGFYIVSVQIIEKILFEHTKTKILDKMDSHEDVMMTVSVYGCGGTVVDIPEIQSQWKQSLWKPRNAVPIVLHPVKNKEERAFALEYMRKFK